MSAEQGLPSWWNRNWKWAVPTGCVTLFAISAAFVAVILVFVFAAMRSNDVYRTAAERAKNSADLLSVIGEPIEMGWFVSGSISVNGASGEADLAIPVSGPMGSCSIYAVAKKTAGRWEYEILEAECENEPERINLLPAEAEVLDSS